MVFPKYRLLIADPIHEQAKSLLASRPGFDVTVATDLSEAQLIQCIGDYDGIVVRSKTRVTGSIISAGRQLKVIARAGIGVDNIDVAAATERGKSRCQRDGSATQSRCGCQSDSVRGSAGDLNFWVAPDPRGRAKDCVRPAVAHPLSQEAPHRGHIARSVPL